MAEKKIYQHHERDTTAGALTDIQERELVFTSQINYMIFKDAGGTPRYILTNTTAGNIILKDGSVNMEGAFICEGTVGIQDKLTLTHDEFELDSETGTDAVFVVRMGTGNSGANKGCISYENSAGTEIFKSCFDNESGNPRYIIESDVTAEAFVIKRDGNILIAEDLFLPNNKKIQFGNVFDTEYASIQWSSSSSALTIDGNVNFEDQVLISESVNTELIALELKNINTGTGAYVRHKLSANGAQAYISLYGATYNDSDYQEALIIQTDSATAGGMKIGTGGPEALVFFTSGIIHPRLTIASDGDVTMAKSLIMPAQADAGEGFIDFTASDASPESPTNQFMMLITPTSTDTDYYTLSSGTDGQIVFFKNAGSVAARVKNIYNEASSISYTIFNAKESAIIYYDDSFGYWRIFGDA